MERGEECSHLGLLQRTQEDGTTQSLGELAEQLRDRCEGGLSQQVHSPLRNPQGKPLCLLSNSGGHHSFLQYYHDVSAVVCESYLYLVLEHSAHPKRELVSWNCQTSQTCNMTASRPSSMTDTALLRCGCNISPVIDGSHQGTSASWLHRGSNGGLHAWGSACCPQLIPLWQTLERWNYCDTGQLVA